MTPIEMSLLNGATCFAVFQYRQASFWSADPAYWNHNWLEGECFYNYMYSPSEQGYVANWGSAPVLLFSLGEISKKCE